MTHNCLPVLGHGGGRNGMRLAACKSGEPSATDCDNFRGFRDTLGT